MVSHRRSQQHQLLSELPCEQIDLTTEVHPMRLTLDSGKLSARSTNQDLISFLDLHRTYHYKFLKRVESHVKDNGYGWLDLLEQEGELSHCARSFVKRFGKKYWGSEKSREKYFYPDAFRDPHALAIYPERKEEISRVVELILEKKARSIAENQGKSKFVFYARERQMPLTEHAKDKSAPDAFYIPSPEPIRESPSPMLYDNRPMFTPDDSGSKLRDHTSNSKRKATDLFGTPTRQQNPIDLPDGQMTSPSRKIRPFGSVIASAIDPPTKKRAPNQCSKTLAPTLNGTEMQNEPPSTLDSSAKDNSEPRSSNNNTPISKGNDDPFVHLYLARSYYPERTIFLVRSNRQPDMGPVWVLFRDFSSASSFLEYMARECHLDDYYWNEQQDDKEPTSTLWASPYSSFPSVFAATVRLEWSGLVIRVRRGKDQDWTILMRELKKAWAASSTAKNPDDEPDHQSNRDDGGGREPQQPQRPQQNEGERFKISVMLHTVEMMKDGKRPLFRG